MRRSQSLVPGNDRAHAYPSDEGRDHRVAGEVVLAKVGPVVEVGIGGGGVEDEMHTVRQRLAPQQLVVATQDWAISVRIPSGRVVPKVERHVDGIDCPHLIRSQLDWTVCLSQCSLTSPSSANALERGPVP